ncbi:hypothetical protein PHJA_002968800 [Phtheirospermum japonicum]|uniref:Uncharacterized protein n=1 Tax=Phtheirospermum japonicum TaxID=374723 RepID=A0A830D6T7_9LAMI|nr:hypothetical protein PHJA_002968800 [Phtheirospermum japonicum]
MENYELNSFEQNPGIHIPEPRVSCSGFDWVKTEKLNQETQVFAMEEDENEESLANQMVCDPCSRLVPSGFTSPCCTGWSFTHLSQRKKTNELKS